MGLKVDKVVDEDVDEDMEEELDKELGVPLRTHAVATIKELKDKVSTECMAGLASGRWVA